ncbi:MAG TPA: NUDIX hydrolase [Candidatus Paceibacterota bacterium]|nr:NUDIX hydrolase [Candidatus Paceibacterota bacterium]
MEAGAIFIIQNEESRFLLEQRNLDPKCRPWSWVFPGGKKEEADATTRDTVIREAKEEFGLEIKPESILKIGEVNRETQEGYLSIYLIEIGQPQKIEINDSAGAGWFSLEEIEKMDLGYNQKARIYPVLISHLQNQQ